MEQRTISRSDVDADLAKRLEAALQQAFLGGWRSGYDRAGTLTLDDVCRQRCDRIIDLDAPPVI